MNLMLQPAPVSPVAVYSIQCKRVRSHSGSSLTTHATYYHSSGLLHLQRNSKLWAYPDPRGESRHFHWIDWFRSKQTDNARAKGKRRLIQCIRGIWAIMRICVLLFNITIVILALTVPSRFFFLLIKATNSNKIFLYCSRSCMNVTFVHECLTN